MSDQSHPFTNEGSVYDMAVEAYRQALAEGEDRDQAIRAGEEAAAAELGCTPDEAGEFLRQ